MRESSPQLGACGPGRLVGYSQVWNREIIMRVLCHAAAALLAGAMLLNSASAGQADVTTQVVVETRAEKILEQQTRILEEATAKQGRYRDLDSRSLGRLKREQETVFSLLEGKTSSEELTPGDQLKLFNSLEAISAIVNRDEDERMVCRRARRTGSNMSETVCKTVAQRREEQEKARETLPSRHAISCGNFCP